MTTTDKLFDVFMAGSTFGLTYELSTRLSAVMPGIAAWCVGGAVVCLAQHLVLGLIFGEAEDVEG